MSKKNKQILKKWAEKVIRRIRRDQSEAGKGISVDKTYSGRIISLKNSASAVAGFSYYGAFKVLLNLDDPEVPKIDITSDYKWGFNKIGDVRISSQLYSMEETTLVLPSISETQPTHLYVRALYDIDSHSITDIDFKLDNRPPSAYHQAWQGFALIARIIKKDDKIHINQEIFGNAFCDIYGVTT